MQKKKTRRLHQSKNPKSSVNVSEAGHLSTTGCNNISKRISARFNTCIWIRLSFLIFPFFINISNDLQPHMTR